MESDAAVHPGQPGAQSAAPGAAADAAVTALYQAHALGLIRLALKRERLAIPPGLGKPARHQHSIAIQVPAGPIRCYQFPIARGGRGGAVVERRWQHADRGGAPAGRGRQLAGRLPDSVRRAAGNRYTPLPGTPNPNQLSVWPAW
jgi:hypothetical protein